MGGAFTLDESELEERFIRASGPGGQNVNKVSTAVELRFDLARNTSLPDAIKAKLARLAGRRLTLEGVIVITAQDHRSQDRNREAARARLEALVAKAAEPPPPPRRKTRPTRASKERRLKGKARRADVKRGRSDRPRGD